MESEVPLFLASVSLEFELKSQFLPGTSGSRLYPSYSGGRDKEDRSSKPAPANSLRVPILKKTHHKKSWWSNQDVGPEFKPQYRQKKKASQFLMEGVN
jgi:hypothetical protein